MMDMNIFLIFALECKFLFKILFILKFIIINECFFIYFFISKYIYVSKKLIIKFYLNSSYCVYSLLKNLGKVISKLLFSLGAKILTPLI